MLTLSYMYVKEMLANIALTEVCVLIVNIDNKLIARMITVLEVIINYYKSVRYNLSKALAYNGSERQKTNNVCR